MDKLNKPFQFKNENKNITEIEEDIMNKWEENKIFEKSLKRGKKSFVFYDGPPFATGSPHYGHLLAGTIKDIICRHHTLKGYNVERKAGWDTHGIPIEMKIEEKIGIRLKQDIIDYGIDNYNNECRKIVMSCVDEWKYTIGRIGRWIDFENDYKTMDTNYMESEWWVFKQLYEKEMVYNGFKIMQYSLGCKTQISNSEANMNYQEVNVDSLFVEFPIINNIKNDKFRDCNLVIWTTTTWTLPSNLTICVNPKITYVKLKYNEKLLIIGKNCINELLGITKKNKNKIKYEILDEFLGIELKDLEYKPIFDYFENRKNEYKNLFKVITDEYVLDSSGTGLTHVAPAFGEDDYRVCIENNIIREDNLICPVDDNGNYTSDIYDFKNKYIFDCEKQLIENIKKNKRLFLKKNIKHRTAYCYRTKTPLIYKACKSLFIKVKSIRDKLIRNNNETYWVPDDIKTNRFHNWLSGARDWAISRSRYWGTPIPLWVSDDFKEEICIGSIRELEEMSGISNITDLHREYIDKITIKSIKTGKILRRIDDVFDCWFESASMPYGQLHYPFENKEYFEKNFPGDFIAEGLDQTRGWFYNLLILSTALFDKPAFKNVIVNGLVLAKDGKKMSKSENNYPNPLDLINRYGADALRMYLINSQLTKAQELKFNEEGVFEMVKNITIPIYNSLNLLNEHYNIFIKNNKMDLLSITNNILDKWIMNKNTLLIENIKKELDEYKLYNISKNITIFIEELNNGYNKINRDYIKGKYSIKEWNDSLGTLYKVLYNISIVLSPLMPFFSEYLFNKLNKINDVVNDCKSVHLMEYSDLYKFEKYDKKEMDNVENIIKIIDSINKLRDRNTISLRRPLKTLKIYCLEEFKDNIEELKEYIRVESNILDIELYNIEDKTIKKFEYNHRTMGKQFKKDKKKIIEYIESLGKLGINEYLEKGKIGYLDYIIDNEYLDISYEIMDLDTKIMEYSESNKILVEISLEYDDNIKNLYHSRLFSTEIQKIRKLKNLKPTDLINVYYNTENKYFKKCIENYKKEIDNIIRCPLIELNDFSKIDNVICKRKINILDEIEINICLCYN